MYFLTSIPTIRTNSIIKRTMSINIDYVIIKIYAFNYEFSFRIERRKADLVIINSSKMFYTRYFCCIFVVDRIFLHYSNLLVVVT